MYSKRKRASEREGGRGRAREGEGGQRRVDRGDPAILLHSKNTAIVSVSLGNFSPGTCSLNQFNLYAPIGVARGNPARSEPRNPACRSTQGGADRARLRAVKYGCESAVK
eukprot:scaffold2110_cov54-Phaeocystis_antarctica.AAC.1